MNAHQGSGTVVRNAVINGTQDKALVFTIVTNYGEHPESKRDLIAHVPCVIFNPAPALQEVLTTDGKGRYVEYTGGVVKQSSYDAQGERRFKTEVHIPKGRLRVSDGPDPFKSRQ